MRHKFAVYLIGLHFENWKNLAFSLKLYTIGNTDNLQLAILDGKYIVRNVSLVISTDQQQQLPIHGISYIDRIY